jgi:putative Holliday junction resolvase
LIGIDYGMKRVGVAVSDDRGSIAFPVATFPNDRVLIPVLQALIRKENAYAVVIGDSRNSAGTENPVMVRAKRFATELQQAIPIVIHFEPEFYTSVEARKTLRHAQGKPGKQAVDAEAAAIILNSYISRKETST